jgi:cobalt/nickel transport protein
MKKQDVWLGLGIAVSLAVCSFLAAPSPDGLERVATKHNFIHGAVSFLRAPIPEYLFPGVASEKVGVALAGVCGVMLMFILTLALARLLVRKKR